MENEEFEAYTLTGYDLNNEDYTEDYPHKIIAHLDGNIETWTTKCIGKWFLKYYRAETEHYTKEAWHKLISGVDMNSSMEYITREDFEHYTSGRVFG